MIGPGAAELRVLGCLIEKQRTTPDAYPLSLNGLRLATNQSTGRDPVVDYGEDEIRDAVAHLVRRGWARLASGPGSRTTKYRHLLDDALSLGEAELALLAVLMLRGAQTPGELRGRSDRLHEFVRMEALEEVLEALEARGLALRFQRRPGQKEARWGLAGPFAGPDGTPDAAFATAPDASRDERPPQVLQVPAAPAPVAAPDGLSTRVDALEAEVRELREVVSRLRELLD